MPPAKPRHRSGASRGPHRLRHALLPLAALAAAAPAPAGPAAVQPEATSERAAASPLFESAEQASGLDFVHFNGMSGEFYFPEMTGQGAALLDYDGDGDLDAYLVQGAILGPGKTLADALVPPQGPLPPSDRLYRNDLHRDADGRLRPRFVDVTATGGLAATGYGMGIATGDYDNDGHVDLYVTNYGPNQLWRNLGDGSFRDVTAEAGVGDELWGTSAAFADLDGDGWLDLYVVNYVEFDLVRNPRCFATSSRRDYCGPSAFPPQRDRLYTNRGDGSFEDVTFAWLRDYRAGPGLGVTAADFNGDGRLDLYVANDGAANQMWLAQPGGGFVDEALFAGTAVNRMGRPEASMGVDAGDFDLDGDEDLFMTHLAGETNTLYVNDGSGLFEDRTVAAGLGGVSLPYTAFGTGWIDYDNDGLPDLLVLNGAVRILEEQAAAGDPYPLKQPKQLLRNLGGRFEEVTARAGPAFAALEVSRGAAFGDVDNDGDVDVLVANNNGPARLLLNRAGQDVAWLGIAAAGAAPATPATGSRVSVLRADGRVLTRRVATDGSYCSARDPRLVAGLGAAATAAHVEARRAAGAPARRWLSPPARRYLVLFAAPAKPIAAPSP